MPSVIRGETTILEHMTKSGRLDNYYKHALGFEAVNELIPRIVGQLSYRRPHMHFLEIGAGTGGSTHGILSKLGTAFASYTYTDISTGFFEKAQERFKTYANRMVFKTLNIEKDPMTQGFIEQAYDVVLAANVLHATKPLEQTLRNARRLLKPGGYLVLLEIIKNDPMRVGLIMGGLPGWWIGREDGRRYAPTISLPEWDSLLKKTGFSGVDTFTPLKDPLPFLASIFATQAVDDGIGLLRRPLSSREDQIPLQNLVLLGGKTQETSRLIDDLESLLKPRCERVIRASSLEDLHGTEIPFMCTVLSLTDLDSPIFKDLIEDRWENLKKLFSPSRNVLWITRGYRCEEPYAAMTVGLCRSVIYELSQLRLQLSDIDHSKKANATLMAELLLRLQLTGQWEKTGTHRDVLWTTEPELILEDEKLNILRVAPHKAQNDRYNSAKRLITKDLDLVSSTVNLEWHDTSYVLREEKGSNAPNPQTDSIVRVEYSLLSSLRTPAGRLFVSLGVDTETSDKVLSVSEKIASTISVPKAWSTPVDVGKGIDAPYLSIVIAYISSQQILSMMPAGGSLLIHEPDPFLASLLSRQIAANGSRVTYTTSNPTINKKHWLYIHPRWPKRTIDAVLPNNMSLFLDLSKDSATVGSVGSRIAASPPELCERDNASVLIARDFLVLSEDHNNDVSEMLRNANSFAIAVSSGIPDGMPLHLVPLRDVFSDTSRAGPLSIVDWCGESTVPTLVETIEQRKDLFEDRKTYWLVGLAGDLGQSLSDWMIDHGARYIILTSRNPKVAEEWIQAGATIACIPGYVNSHERVCKRSALTCRVGMLQAEKT